MMRQLLTIIKTEYLTDIKSKSFWISSILIPIFIVGFGIVMGFLAGESETLQNTANPFMPDSDEEISGWQILGMLVGIVLTMFIMMNGAQIFNKVKVEKCNRIVEILATCVEGRTMMMAKILSVALISLTQMLLWGVLCFLFFGVIIYVFSPVIPMDFLLEPRFWLSLLWALLFFIGGYVFYGSLYAACGAMTDKNSENQEYMTILTFVLLGAFYLGTYTVDHSSDQLAMWFGFIPFTSPTIATVRAIAGDVPLWQTIVSLVVLYASAWYSVAFAGKIYKSTLLLTGKRLSPKDIIVFFKTK